MDDKKQESFLQREIRRKVSELCGEIQLLEQAVKSMIQPDGKIGCWSDGQGLADDLKEAAERMGEVAFHLHTYGPFE